MGYSKKQQLKRKKTTKKKSKLITLPKLEKQIWTLFSLSVRVAWADDKGFCKCVTCPAVVYYHGGACHAGHFRPRNQKSVKFNRQNVHPQCATCNTYGEGEQYQYGLWLDEHYGEGTAQRLTDLGFKSIRDVFPSTREHLMNVRAECIEFLHKYGLRFPEWQANVSKKLLKEIEEWTAT